MPMIRDNKNNVVVDVFSPSTASTYSGVVIPTEPVAIRLGSDVVITINALPLTYTEGEVLVLQPNVSYTFGTSTIVHIMFIS